MKQSYPFPAFVDLVFNDNVVAFYMGTPFCNFMVRPGLFRDDYGRQWDSSEAYFMAQKLWFHGWESLAGFCLRSSDCPGLCKSLGRRINNYNELAWSRARYAYMLKAVTMKFLQNPDLAGLLLGTGDRVLVEASPIDPWWGVGTGTDHPDILTPSRWKGTNLLGTCLMEVRRFLRVMYRNEISSVHVPKIGSREYARMMASWKRGITGEY